MTTAATPKTTGRPSAVWYWASRKRWAINIHGKRRTAPTTIAPHDLRAAEKWAQDLLAAESPDRLEYARSEPLNRKPGRVTKEINILPETAQRLDQIARGDYRILDTLIKQACGNSHQAKESHRSEPPSKGVARVRKEVNLRPVTIQRLKRLVIDRRLATGNHKIHPGQILDDLIEAAYRNSRPARTSPKTKTAE